MMDRSFDNPRSSYTHRWGAEPFPGHKPKQRDPLPESDSPFMAAVTNETKLLLRIVNRGLLEQIDHPKMGVELEGWFVDAKTLDPLPISPKIIEALGSESGVVTELPAFQGEINSPVYKLTESNLSRLEDWLHKKVEEVDRVAAQFGAKFVISGMLPTLNLSHLTEENLTPHPRYKVLNAAERAIKGGDFVVELNGPDSTMEISHDSIILAGTGCGLQPHLQVTPEEFVPHYNAALAASSILAAVTASSPLFLGEELWHSSRIHLLHEMHRGLKTEGDKESSRFFFGKKWARNVLDDFDDNIAVPPFFDAEVEPPAGSDPLLLPNLMRQASTVWKFNRAKYDVQEEKPHVRIENRVPDIDLSVRDNVANLAFFYGLVVGLADVYGDISRKLEISDVRDNFYEASRFGLDATLTWFDGEEWPAQRLALHLMPVVWHGLCKLGVSDQDIQRYIGDTIQPRIRSGSTSSKWILDKREQLMEEGHSQEEAEREIVRIIHENQLGEPVHRWN